jgi:hypothetical protein
LLFACHFYVHNRITSPVLHGFDAFHVAPYTAVHVGRDAALGEGQRTVKTFAQYAATRLLREHAARTLTFGGVAVGTGAIQTFAGVDLITGMPVLIYTLPERPADIPAVFSDSIPAILETGFEHGMGYVIAASAPGFAPLKPTLSQPRMEWLARLSAQALVDAHAVGLFHGNLEPAHFLANNDALMLEGWGLPWGEANPDYRAPEGGTSAAADVFAWARSLQMLGRGNARLMLTGEMGRWIAHGLNPKPGDRPTAQEMVLALEKLSKRAANPVSSSPTSSASSSIAPTLEPTGTPVEPPLPTETRLQDLEAKLSAELPPLEPAAPVTLEPSKVLDPLLEVPEEPATENLEPEAPSARPGLEEATEPLPERMESDAHVPVFNSDPAQLHEPEHLAADEPDVKLRPPRESEFDPEAPEPGLLVRREANPIRIGFEEDDESWRQVVRPTDGSAPRRAGLERFLLPGIITVVLALLVAGLAWWFLRPRAATDAGVTPLTVPGDPVAGTVVNFTLRPGSNLSGRLSVVAAPEGSTLTPGSVLASVPGPVLFTTTGAYKLRVTVDGYKPAEFTLNVPGQTEIVLELRQ